MSGERLKKKVQEKFKKILKANKEDEKRAQNNAKREHLTRESFARVQRMKHKLRITRLTSAIDHEMERLSSCLPKRIREEEETQALHELKNKKFKLKGAARPAHEAYPELYPELYQEKRRKEIEREEAKENLIEKHMGEYSKFEETRKLLALKFELAHEFLSESDGSSKAMVAFEELLKLDKRDVFGSRLGLIFACIDAGELLRAREVAEECLMKSKVAAVVVDIPSEIYWALTLIEYISFAVLEEKGSDEQKALVALSRAIDSNPLFGAALKVHEHLSNKLDPLDVDQVVRESRQIEIEKLLKSLPDMMEEENLFPRTSRLGAGISYGVVENALVYFARQISCWKDADGSLEWLIDTIEHNRLLNDKWTCAYQATQSLENAPRIPDSNVVFNSALKSF